MKQQFLKYLEENRPLYAGARFAIHDPRGEVAFASDGGFLVRLDFIEYASAQNPQALEAILPLIQTDDVVSYDPCVDAALPGLGFTCDIVCRDTLYQGKEPLALTLPAGVEIRRLSHEWDDFVYAHYSHAEGRPDYVAERIEAGMLGLFERGEMAGFIGTHDTGEMGLLEVLPAFRRKGYASLLEAALINARLEEGVVAYGNVETWNEPSMGLQHRLGMSISEGITSWFSR